MADDRYIEILGRPRAVFGMKKAPPDPRDAQYALKCRFLARFRLPAVKDNGRFAPRVEDQAVLGSCVGHGVSSAGEMFLRSRGKFPGELSRLFPYWMSRVKIDK